MVKIFKNCGFIWFTFILTISAINPGTEAQSNATSEENCITDGDLCLSPECIALSHQILTYGDLTVDPCEDFYQFACGGFEKELRDGSTTYFVGDIVQKNVDFNLKNFLESNFHSNNEQINSVFQQLKIFHSSCMNNEGPKNIGFTKIRKFFETFANLNFEIKETDVANLTKIITEMLKYGDSPFFSVQISHFDYETNQYDVYISPTAFPQQYFSDKGKNSNSQKSGKSKLNSFNQKNKNKTAILEDWNDNFLSQLHLRLNEFLENVFPDVSRVILATVETELKQFYKAFYNMKTPPNKNETEVSMKISELQEHFHWVNWKLLLEKTFRKSLNDDFEVIVANLAFIRDLDKLFKSYNKNNSVIKYAALALFYDSVLSDLVGKQDWKSCMKMTKMALSHSLSIIYNEMLSPDVIQSIKNDTRLIFGEIKEIFKIKINGSQWMSNLAKMEATNKVKKMKGEFARLKFSTNDDIFRNLTWVVLDETDFFQNTLILYSQFMITQRNGINLKKSSSKFNDYFSGSHHFEATADHHPESNKISLNLGGFSPPHYTSGAPKYVTFGNVGFMTAFMMTHFFGPDGVNFDSSGFENGWSTSNDEESFKNITNCFVELYSETFDKLFNGENQTIDGFKLNGRATLNKNIADSGINMAYQAYKFWVKKNKEEPKLPGIKFNPDQIFFISAAHSFCSVNYLENYEVTLESSPYTPIPERVNILAINSEDFSKVFQCSAKSTMNQRKRCSLW